MFRVDHVLGMATVQNLLALRRHDPLLEPVWNSAHIEQVEILWEETLALEGRAGYYDRAGALKDVIQNHLLQVLCLVAMEPPAGPASDELRDRKVDVLRAVRRSRPMTRRCAHAGAPATSPGGIGDRRDVPAYVDEDGVDPSASTETFAEVVLELDSPRWRGTRFVLRAGKALAPPPQGGGRALPCHRAAAGEAAACARHRRPGATSPCSSAAIGADDPEPGAPPRLGSARLRPRPARSPRRRQHALGARRRGRGGLARASTPVLAAWRDGLVPLEEYPAGSDGPA